MTYTVLACCLACNCNTLCMLHNQDHILAPVANSSSCTSSTCKSLTCILDACLASSIICAKSLVTNRTAFMQLHEPSSRYNVCARVWGGCSPDLGVDHMPRVGHFRVVLSSKAPIPRPRSPNCVHLQGCPGLQFCNVIGCQHRHRTPK